jgi:tRNA modification GTPase
MHFPERKEDVIDEGLCLWFPGPQSFTGEDCAELQLHGGPAVVRAMLGALSDLDGLRLAEPGEFSRRALENGRHDLTEIEGLSDLIAAETEMQRKQAVAQAGGAFRDKLEEWRERIVRMRALVETEFDFSEEEDIPGGVEAGVWDEAGTLAGEMRRKLEDGRRGEIIREGYQIVLLGPPNAGKSSLLNALAKRDVAIVTEEAGTTRDLIEVHLDLDGYAVTVIDTAGMRETQAPVEKEGIRRARLRADKADLVIWLWPVEDAVLPSEARNIGDEIMVVRSKDDGGKFGSGGISVKRPDGLSGLIGELKDRLGSYVGGIEAMIVSRARHREQLTRCAERLEKASAETELATELRTELLRDAGDAIGKITGRIETEHLLDHIFKEFCIGK